VESVYSKKRDVPKNFLDGVVGDTKRQVENERVEEVVSSGSIDHDLRAALEVRIFAVRSRATYNEHDSSESMEASIPPFQFLSTTALSTLSCWLTGKTKLLTSQRMSHYRLTPRGRILWLPSTRRSSLVHGRKALSGILEHHSVTLHRSNSIMETTLFQRSALPVRNTCSLHRHILTF
jgi:hypothetical protein